MYKIGIFIPASHLEAVKQSMFAAGAGRIGNYDCCAWQTLGQGQFRPMQESQPFIGQQGVIATVEEYRVEMVCDESVIKAVIAAMKRAHPYETPAYDVWQLTDI
jgi:hypothetical protein